MQLCGGLICVFFTPSFIPSFVPSFLECSTDDQPCGVADYLIFLILPDLTPVVDKGNSMSGVCHLCEICKSCSMVNCMWWW